MSVIISLDQAKVTGVAVFDDKKLIKHTSINSNEDDYEKVIFDIAEKVQSLIDKHEPEIILLEDVANQTNSATHKKLSMLLGALILLCNINQVKYKIIHSSTWRSIIRKHIEVSKKRLNRTEWKSLSKQLVKDKYNLAVKDDISDAICMGLYYIESGSKE